jgi:hypothetical protein
MHNAVQIGEEREKKKKRSEKIKKLKIVFFTLGTH